MKVMSFDVFSGLPGCLLRAYSFSNSRETVFYVPRELSSLTAGGIS